MVRNESIDTLKGILIILVIVGHVLLGTLDENVFRYVIYSFHMPVFFFISGYLINWQKIQKLTINGLLGKYWHRMLLPWAIALILYSLALSAFHFTFFKFVKILLHPYYHLWYVPTLFAFISIVWVISHIKEKTIAIIFAIALGLIFHCLLFKEGCFRMSYFIYFITGIMAKNTTLKIMCSNAWGGVIFAIFLITVLFLFVHGISITFYIEKLRLPFMLMVCLLSFLPLMIKNKLKSTLLRYIGIHSLEIYLWHVFPIMILKYLFKDCENQCIYYLLAFCMILILLTAIHIKTKYSVVKQ